MSPRHQPTVLFSIYQNNNWTIRRLVYETIDPVTQRIISKIVGFQVICHEINIYFLIDTKIWQLIVLSYCTHFIWKSAVNELISLHICKYELNILKIIKLGIVLITREYQRVLLITKSGFWVCLNTRRSSKRDGVLLNKVVQ